MKLTILSLLILLNLNLFAQDCSYDQAKTVVIEYVDTLTEQIDSFTITGKSRDNVDEYYFIVEGILKSEGSPDGKVKTGDRLVGLSIVDSVSCEIIKVNDGRITYGKPQEI